MYVLQMVMKMCLLKGKLLTTIDFVHICEQSSVCLHMCIVHVHSPVMNNDKGIFATQYTVRSMCHLIHFVCGCAHVYECRCDITIV